MIETECQEVCILLRVSGKQIKVEIEIDDIMVKSIGILEETKEWFEFKFSTEEAKTIKILISSVIAFEITNLRAFTYHGVN